MQPPEKSSPDLESVTIPGFFIAQRYIAYDSKTKGMLQNGEPLFKRLPVTVFEVRIPIPSH
jgi:hypothetical protein